MRNRLLGDAKTGVTYSGLLPEGSRVAVKRLIFEMFGIEEMEVSRYALGEGAVGFLYE